MTRSLANKSAQRFYMTPATGLRAPEHKNPGVGFIVLEQFQYLSHGSLNFSTYGPWVSECAGLGCFDRQYGIDIYS